jgi:hypothetical protein
MAADGCLLASKTGQLAREEFATWPMLSYIFCSILDLHDQRIRRKAMSESNRGGSSRNTVMVTLIVVVGIIILTCILAFTAVSVAFVLNAPW